jgi:hypothetical protein
MLSRRGFLIGTGGLLTMAFVSDARAFIRRKEQEVDMVFRRDEKGGGWHEPPYTWEEEMELYRRMSPKEGFTTYHGSPRKRGPVPVAEPKKEADGGC